MVWVVETGIPEVCGQKQRHCTTGLGTETNLAREVANLDHRGLTVRIGGQLMSGVAILLDKPGLPILKSKWCLPLCRHPAKRLSLSPSEAKITIGLPLRRKSAKAVTENKSRRSRTLASCARRSAC
jgi:hypothetical protein